MKYRADIGKLKVKDVELEGVYVELEMSEQEIWTFLNEYPKLVKEVVGMLTNVTKDV